LLTIDTKKLNVSFDNIASDKMATETRIGALALDPSELSRTQTRKGKTVVDDEKETDAHEIEKAGIAVQVSDTPLKYRLLALSCILFFTTGSAFAESTLGPLKSTFVRELKINSGFVTANRG